MRLVRLIVLLQLILMLTRVGDLEAGETSYHVLVGGHDQGRRSPGRVADVGIT